MQHTSECVIRQLCRLGLLGFGLMFAAALARAEAPSSPEDAAPGASQSQPKDSARLSNLPGTVPSPGSIQPALAAEIPCDYWIVSSRKCKGAPAGSGTSCLEFLHRTSERDLRDEGRTAFLASFKPDVPACFIVHGSYNWWRDVVNESRRINRWVRSSDPAAPLQVVFFTWPSDGNMPLLFPVDIAVLGRKSAAHSYYLARLISELPREQPVSILGHSHGARATVAALHLLGGGVIEDGQALPRGSAAPTHLRAVLIAAAIDHNWINPGQRYGQALVPPERVLLLRNSRDATLAIYPLRKGWAGRALGRDGLGTDDRMTMNGLQKKIVDLDAAQFAGPYHSFADYHEHRELASAVSPYVYLREEGAKAPGVPTTPYDGLEPDANPIVPKAAPVAAPSSAAPASDGRTNGPELVPAVAPLLTPPAADETIEADERPSDLVRTLRIMPRSRKASHEKVRGEQRAGDRQAPASQAPRTQLRSFEMWLEE